MEANDLSSDGAAAVRLSEARQLGRIGASLQHDPTMLQVEIPLSLADAAVEAWNREDLGPVPLDESPNDRLIRHRAGSLALIGLALTERGHRLSDGYLVDLDAWFVGHALDAAEAMGLIVARQDREQVSPVGRPPGFVNIDLDLSSPREMPALHTHLATAGIVLRYEQEDQCWALSFELADNPDSLLGTADQMLNMIESLPEPELAEWNSCTSRVLDVGLHAGVGQHQPIVSLDASLIARSAKVEAEVRLTFYPHHDSSGRYVHHPIR